MKMLFTILLIVWTKKVNSKDFKYSTKCWICDNVYTEIDVKLRCHITGKYRSLAHVDWNINVKLKYKVPILFHNLKNYDLHLIMQELGKPNFKISVIPNGLEKYMNFNINNNLIFIDNFQLLSSSLDVLIVKY